MEIFRGLSYIFSYIFILLFFFLFINQKYSKKVFLLIASVAVIILFVTDIIKLILYADNSFMYVAITLFQIILTQGIAFFTSKNRNDKTLFVALCGSNYVLIGTIIGIIIYIYTKNTVISIVVNLLIHIIILLLLFFTTRKKLMDIYYKNNMKRWWELCLIPALFYAAISFLSVFPYSLFDKHDNIAGLIILLLMMIVIYSVILHYIEGEINRSEIYRKNEIFMYYIKGLESQYESVEKSEQNLRILRHDMRHYAELINSLIEQEKYEEIKNIMKYINNTVKENKVQKFCENIKVNSIVSKMVEKADSMNIEIEIDMNIPEELPFSDIELAGVVANIMENAITAEKNLEVSEKKINLLVKYVDNRLIIEMRNKCQNNIHFNPITKLPMSIKGEGHGIGFQSISTFANKINANLDCFCEDGVFTIRMLANI